MKTSLEPNKNILEVKNVYKTFRNGKYTVYASNDVSFDIPQGKVIGLIGESGSGKTTIGRTIMNLLYPDSGSIKIHDTEIAEKKLSRKQRNILYRNIQMIFQDPYSSLNTQKNIMKIVSESLGAKGMDKDLFNDFFVGRDKVLFFSKYTLRNIFFEYYWDYLLFEIKSNIKSAKEIFKQVNSFKIDKTTTPSENFKNFSSNIYNIKENNNYKVISKINNLNSFLFKKWLNEKKKVLSKNYSDKDEKDLDQIREKHIAIKKEIKESPTTQMLKENLKLKNANYKELVIEKKLYISTVKKQYKNTESNLIKKANSFFLDKLESTNESDYQNFELLCQKERIKIKIIKSLRRNSVYLDLNQVLNSLEKNNFKLFGSFNIDKFHNKSNSNINHVIKELINQLEANNILTFNSNLLKLKKQIENLKLKLGKSIEDDKTRDLGILKAKAESIAQDKIKYESIFKNELHKYIVDNEAKITLICNKRKEEISNLNAEFKPLGKITKKQEKKTIKEILSLKKYNEKSHKKQRKVKKALKNKYKDIVKKDKALHIEIKESVNILKSLKFLYGISKFNIKFLAKRSLRDVLVRTRVFETLEKVGLNRSAAYRYPHEFSGGMRQRVGIARAIISKPKLIIADEPIAALDLSIQAQIVNLLMDLKKSENLSMLFIAHDLSMIEHNSDEVIIMHLGRIVEKGKTELVFKNPIHPYTKTLIESIPTISKINQKFKDIKFIPEYLKEYNHNSIPKFHQISHEHFVFGTDKQIKKWK